MTRYNIFYQEKKQSFEASNFYAILLTSNKDCTAFYCIIFRSSYIFLAYLSFDLYPKDLLHSIFTVPKKSIKIFFKNVM